jgi:hypothetical protein
MTRSAGPVSRHFSHLAQEGSILRQTDRRGDLVKTCTECHRSMHRFTAATDPRNHEAGCSRIRRDKPPPTHVAVAPVTGSHDDPSERPCQMTEDCEQPARDNSKYCARHGAIDGVKPRTSGNSQLVCPHCQSRGTVVAVRVTRKVGVSGGKATGAILTGGTSLFVTGLSRKEKGTRFTCDRCHVKWQI